MLCQYTGELALLRARGFEGEMAKGGNVAGRDLTGDVMILKDNARDTV